MGSSGIRKYIEAILDEHICSNTKAISKIGSDYWMGRLSESEDLKKDLLNVLNMIGVK